MFSIYLINYKNFYSLKNVIISSLEKIAQVNISTCHKNATSILKANDIFENLNLTDVCSQVCRM